MSDLKLKLVIEGDGGGAAQAANSAVAAVDNLKAKTDQLADSHVRAFQAQQGFKASLADFEKKTLAAAAAEQALADKNRALSGTFAEFARNVGSSQASAAQSTRLNVRELQNMQFQLQDVAVGLSSGQSPFTVIMQQGSQMAQLFRGGTGPLAAIKAVGSSMVAFLTNPVNLAVVAIAGLTAGVSALWGAIGQGSDQASILEKHNELIKQLKEGYKGAAEEVAKFNAQEAELMKLSLALERNALNKKTEDLVRQSVRNVQANPDVGGPFTQRVKFFDTEGSSKEFVDLRQKWEDFVRGVANGTASAEDFRIEIARMVNDAPPNAGKIRELAQTMINSLKPMADHERLLKENSAVTDLLNGRNVEASKSTLGMADSISKAGAAAEQAARQFSTLGNASYFGDIGSKLSSGFTTIARKGLLDLIAASEGTSTKRDYNETLGYGRFTGGPVDLVSKTVDQVIALQRSILEQTSKLPKTDPLYNSSAAGRYQIVGATLRSLKEELGLSGDEVFNPQLQDLLASTLINRRGRNPKALRNEWEGLRRVPDSDIFTAFDASGPDRSDASGEVQKARADHAKKITAEMEKEIASVKKSEAADKAWQAVLRQGNSVIDLQTAALGKGTFAQEKARRAIELTNDAHRIFGEELGPDIVRSIDQQSSAYARLQVQQEQNKKAAEELAKKQKDASEEAIKNLDSIRGVFDGLGSAFFKAKDETGSWGKALDAVFDSLKNKGLSLLDDLIDKLLNSVLFGKKGEEGGGLFGGFLEKLFGGLFNGGGGGLYAQGGAFTNSIVTSPTAFGHGNRKLGIMGEAGPEAIMPLAGHKGGYAVKAMTKAGETLLPLTRMANGDLGVAMEGYAQGAAFGALPATQSASRGGGYAGQSPTVNLTVVDQAGVKATANTSQNRDGGLDIEVLLEKRIDGKLQVFAGQHGLRKTAGTWG